MTRGERANVRFAYVRESLDNGTPKAEVVHRNERGVRSVVRGEYVSVPEFHNVLESAAFDKEETECKKC